MAPLGKKELLRWAAEASGVRPCDKYADLRDGVVLLALAARLFPASVDPRPARRGPVDAARNWEALRRVMGRHGLPLHLCDRRAVAAGHARHCFNLLVLFYFLARLAQDSEFSVDFANPVDAGVAAFLQSPRSLRCVGKLPAACDEPPPPPASSASPPPPPSPSLPATAAAEEKEGEEVGAATCLPPAASPGTAANNCSDAEAQVGRCCGDDGGGVADLQSLRLANARLQEELEHVRATSRLMLAQQRALLAGEVARTAEQFEVRLALLRLERDHEVRQCLLDVREAYDGFLRDALEKAPPLPGTSTAADADVPPGVSLAAHRALEGKARAYAQELAEARDTVQQLRGALQLQRDRHEAFAERVCHICATGPADGAASDEDGLVQMIDGMLEAQPQPVRAAVALRLRTLLAQAQAGDAAQSQSETHAEEGAAACCGAGGDGAPLADAKVRQLRTQVERLRQANQFLRQQHLPPPRPDLNAVPLADGLEAPSCTIDAETCDAICVRASAVVEAHTPVDSLVRQEMRRLVLAVQILQARVQTAADALLVYRDKQQGLHEQLLCLQEQCGSEAHAQARAAEVRLEEQRQLHGAREAALTTQLRLVEERAQRRESAAAALHERAREMFSACASLQQQLPGLSGGGAAAEALRRVLADATDAQRTRDAMEAALSELSGEVAALRHDRAQQEQTVGSLQTSLAAAEAAVREARAAANAAGEAAAVEVDACRRYIGRVRELLLTTPMAKVSPPAPPPSLTGPAATTTTPPPQATRQTRDTAAAAATPSLLSAEELERRKRAILSKVRLCE
ncbi:uncharacterized protein Tco025E_06044 [Trypanosoma conorhini]|uniref:Calponin-homology (CH) domain-containing protein n=1 Tax=Trypanosoma conorhini TaxID=83891 RepID=A0A3R7RVK4_9TRYP|nr:uncharacterized protein Tco025E_06044 [Trypanosoma conorhini]RNF13887.1 hypothetical protein Tco025E_06044 [Trypanosoma conorhini]